LLSCSSAARAHGVRFGLGLGLHGVGRGGQRWLLRLLFYRVYPVFACD